MLQDETEKHLENEESVLELETKVIELQIKVEETDSELNSMNEKYALKCKNIEELKETIASLTSNKEMASKELQLLRSRYHDLEMQNSCLSQDLTNHMTALQKQQSHNEDIEKSLANLRAEFQEKEEDFSFQLSGNCKKVNTLTSRLQEIETELTSVRQERDALLKEHEENEAELEKSWKKIKDAEDALTAKDKELKICQDKLDVATVEYGWNKQSWQDSTSSLKKQLVSAESKIESLKHDLDNTKKKLIEQGNEKGKQLNMANNKIKEIEESLSFSQLKLNAQIKTTEKEQSLIVRLKSRVRCANEKLEKEKCKLQEQISKKKIIEEALKTMKCENEKIVKELATLQTTCEEKDRQIKLLQEESPLWLGSQNEMSQLESKLKCLEKEHEELIKQLSQKTADNEASEELCKTLQVNCQQLEMEISDMKAKFHSETNIALQQSETKYKCLEEEHKRLNEQLCKKSAHIKSLEELCSSLQVNHEQLMKELSDLKNKQKSVEHMESKFKCVEKKYEALVEQLQQKIKNNRAADELCKSLQTKCQKLEKELLSLKNKPYLDENDVQNLREQLKEKSKQLQENESELAEVWVKYADSLQEGNSLREKCKYLKVKLQFCEEELKQKSQESQTEKIVDKENKENVNVTVEKMPSLPSDLYQRASSSDTKRTDPSKVSDSSLPPFKGKSKDCPPVNQKRAQAQPSSRKRFCKENLLSPSMEQSVNTQTITRGVLTTTTDNISLKDGGKSEQPRENERQQRLRKGEKIVSRSGVKVRSPYTRKETSVSSTATSNDNLASPTRLPLHNTSSETFSVMPSPLSYANQRKGLPSADDCKLQ